MSEDFVRRGFQNRFHARYQNSTEIAFHQVEVKTVLFCNELIKLQEQRVGTVHKAGAVKAGDYASQRINDLGFCFVKDISYVAVMSIESPSVDISKAGQFTNRDRSDVLTLHDFKQCIAYCFFGADNSFVGIISCCYSHILQPFYTECIFIHMCIL